MNFKPVLIKRYDNRINSDLRKLKETYQDYADTLNELQQELAEFEDRTVGLLEVVTFIRHDNPKSYLLGRFVENQDFKGIPIKPDKLEELLDIPPYQHIIEMRSSFTKWTREEITAYYDEEKKEFSPIEVAADRKEKIVKEHSIYITDQQEYKNYQAATKFCEALANFFRRDGVNEVTPFKLRDNFPYLFRYLKGVIVEGMYRQLYTWEVDPEYWRVKRDHRGFIIK